MADVRKTLQRVGKQVQQVADQVNNIADHVAKSGELVAIKEKAAEELEAIKKTVSEVVDRISSARQRTFYTEIAEACEGVNDALLREEGGTTAKMTKVAAVKLGAIGTSAGIFGVAATVGTASTGTAIGALTGAAATSATLAWVGGSVAMGTAIVGTVAVGESLAFGPSHVSGSARPVTKGTSVISAHRDTHFQILKRVKPGSVVTLERADGVTRDYEVRETRVLSKPKLLLPPEDGHDRLILVTCWPFDAVVPDTQKRFSVLGERIR
jgi:LPXTG-site transpeptidase (sortase) family protein